MYVLDYLFGGGQVVVGLGLFVAWWLLGGAVLRDSRFTGSFYAVLKLRAVRREGGAQSRAVLAPPARRDEPERNQRPAPL
jgi:hypothetical protein